MGELNFGFLEKRMHGVILSNKYRKKEQKKRKKKLVPVISRDR